MNEAEKVIVCLEHNEALVLTSEFDKMIQQNFCFLDLLFCFLVNISSCRGSEHCTSDQNQVFNFEKHFPKR